MVFGFDMITTDVKVKADARSLIDQLRMMMMMANRLPKSDMT